MKENPEKGTEGHRALSAPDGCGFAEEVAIPIVVKLMCLECQQPMPCMGTAAPTNLIMSNGMQKPAKPKFVHVCMNCKAKALTDVPFPQIRHEPHPEYRLTPTDTDPPDNDDSEDAASPSLQVVASAENVE